MMNSRFASAVMIFSALVGWSVFGDSLTLDKDVTVNVPEGETVTYKRLLGDGHTLTKTGPGRLVFSMIRNEKAVFDIREGSVCVSTVNLPSVVTDKAVLFLDAEHGLTTYEQGGTNFVSRWNDVRTSQTDYYAEAKPPTSAGYFVQPPFLRAPCASTNTTGRAVIETGPMKTPQAACFIVKNGPDFAEAFVVAMDTEDVKTLVDRGYTGVGGRASPFIGMDAANWLRGNRTESGVNSSIAQAIGDNQKKITNGAFELDGQTSFGDKAVDCSLPYPDGFHVLNVRPTEVLKANYLSCDRGGADTAGGLRYGSVILFSETLSAEERTDVTDYLLQRWKGERLERVLVSPGATFEVDESCPLVVGSRIEGGVLVKDGNWQSQYYGPGEGVTSVDVRAGRYDGRVFTLSGSWMHLDASQSDTLTLTAVNGTNMVSKWKDANGRQHYAQPSPTGASNPPFLSSVKLNGLPVVDFGEYWCGSACTAEGRWGGVLYWDSTCLGVRDVFTVAMDTEDLKIKNALWETGLTATRAAPFVGNTEDAHFYRGNRSDPSLENSTVVNTGGNTPDYTCSVDGAPYVKASTVQYPDGFHVLHLKTNREDSNGNSFTAERTNSRGGQRIAEFVVCNEDVSSADAAKTVNYLRAKWFRAGTNELSLVDVSVAAGAELDFEKLAVTGSLNLDGTLDVTEVDTSAIRVTGGAGCVKGKLKLADTGTLNVDWPRAMFRQFRNREVRLLGFDMVEGDLSGWTVKASVGALKNVTLKDDGIYATPQPNGLVLTVR